MIMHPGVLALVVGSSVTFGMTCAASLVGLRLLRCWDYDSASPLQLTLERQTYLVSALVNWVLPFEFLALFLFVYTTESLHPLFSGAMCSTGTLNANPVGWWLLVLKIILFFAASIWVAINYIDQHAEQFPFIRVKYWMLLFIMPLVGLDLWGVVVYFLGLDPEVITSCCGSLFSSQSSGLAAEISGIPPKEMLIFYYFTASVQLGSTLYCLFRRKKGRFFLAFVSLLFLGVALAAIISSISAYIYELPTHHCPFDMLQGHYNFIGYPIYITLFVGVLFGFLPGVFALCLRGRPPLYGMVQKEHLWLWLSLASIISHLLFSSWSVVFGHLDYIG